MRLKGGAHIGRGARERDALIGNGNGDRVHVMTDAPLNHTRCLGHCACAAPVPRNPVALLFANAVHSTTRRAARSVAVHRRSRTHTVARAGDGRRDGVSVPTCSSDGVAGRDAWRAPHRQPRQDHQTAGPKSYRSYRSYRSHRSQVLPLTVLAGRVLGSGWPYAYDCAVDEQTVINVRNTSRIVNFDGSNSKR
jgi:hypothetical protein